jgi:RNA polymerase sigma factor (sigma-70 family)
MADQQALTTHMSAALNEPLLRPEQERSLITRARRGDAAARETLMRRNLRLVQHIALRCPSPAAEPEDLFQEGVIGLLRAIDRFDPKRGTRFSTYAIWWIRNFVWRAAYPTRTKAPPPTVISLNERIHNEVDATIETTLDDPSWADPFDRADSRHRVATLLRSLDGQQRLVLCLRYGLDGGDERTNREVGELMGYSREWVRKSEARAVTWLRATSA